MSLHAGGEQAGSGLPSPRHVDVQQYVRISACSCSIANITHQSMHARLASAFERIKIRHIPWARLAASIP